MIEKIGHYSITNPSSIYDEEAMTALELAGRTAGKVNEAIGAFNKLETETETHLKAQDESIPVKIAEKVDEYVEDGEFDEAINRYAGDLEGRLENLLGSVTEGSTTLDAEVIDIRKLDDGSTHPTAGSAVRKGLNKRTAYASIFLNESPTVVHTNDNITVTLNGATHVYYNSKMYQLTDVSASYAHTNSSLFILLWDSSSQTTISIQHHASQVPDRFVVIGWIYKGRLFFSGGYNNTRPNIVDSTNPLTPLTWSDDPVTFEVSVNDTAIIIDVNMPTFYIYSGDTPKIVSARNVNFVTTTDKHLFRIVYNPTTDELTLIHHAETIDSRCVSVGMLHIKYGAFLNGNTHHNRENVLALPALILGHSNTFIEFDNVNKTVTFPGDTLLMSNHSSKPFAYLAPVGNSVVVSYKDATSSALMVCFNLNTETLTVKQYNTLLDRDEIVIATFRTSGSVSILAPYKWNGKPYNLDLTPNVEDVTVEAVNYNVKSICHRGYTADGATENTIQAFEDALKHGFRYVECDVRFSSDQVPYLMHDETLERTHGDARAIADITDSELRALGVTNFVSFINWCKRRGVHAYIEVKDATEDQLSSIYYTLVGQGMTRNVTIISFNRTHLTYLAGMLGERARYGLIFDVADDIAVTQFKVDMREHIDNVEKCCFIDVNIANVSDAADIAYGYELDLEVWTVNDANTIRNIHPGVSGVTSDTLHAGRILYETPIN